MIVLLAAAVTAWIMTCYLVGTTVLERCVDREGLPDQAPHCSCRTGRGGLKSLPPQPAFAHFDTSAIERMCDRTEPLDALLASEPIPA
ncbi:hypothetical protein [Nocardia sp. R7R-8]|uniref:hypothetical protein n=1 Tax=Nocardia sp. R7R-8 TaxID=3459304 RepID=UPI00403DDBEE